MNRAGRALHGAWTRAVHERYCGTPPSCGGARDCPGLPGGTESTVLWELLAANPPAFVVAMPRKDGGAS